MSDIARQKLIEIISRFGVQVCEDPKRCEGLLRDLCGDKKREITILVAAIREGVTTELRGSQGAIPLKVLLARCAQRLCNNVGIMPELARWGVETWGLALGVISPEELGNISVGESQKIDNKSIPSSRGANRVDGDSSTSFSRGSLAIETNSIGMKLVLIPKGTFTMGSPPSEVGSNDDERQHEVTISRNFYLGIYPVTQAQYEMVMGKNPSYFQGDKVATRNPPQKHPTTGRTIVEEKIIHVDSSNHPVEQVSWDDAVEFCQRLSALPKEKAAGRVYRLPTEAEWEYACRAGSETAYSFGDEVKSLVDYAWYEDNSNDQTHAVGQKKANAWGLYDMPGNVWEWCSDWYDDYPKGAVSDPSGPSGGVDRVYRGGCWDYKAAHCRSSSRDSVPPTHCLHYSGFRLALSSSSGIPK